MDLGIGGIGELLQDHRVRGLFGQFVRLGDGALHAFGPRRQDNLGAESQQDHAALQRHGLRHDQNQTVPARSRGKSNADPGVAAGRLNQHGLSRYDSA